MWTTLLYCLYVAILVYGYSFQPSIGASGGLLFVSDKSEVEVWSTTSIDRFLAIKGQFVCSQKELVFINVYVMCEFVAKQALWDRLSGFIQQHATANFCL